MDINIINQADELIKYVQPFVELSDITSGCQTNITSGNQDYKEVLIIYKQERK